MCTNIDDFNRGAALILSTLYRSFPVKTMLKICDLDNHLDLMEDERNKRVKERIVVYEAAAIFLMEEGFIRYSQHIKDLGLFHNTVLTTKGLASLNKTMPSLSMTTDTVGDTLISCTGEMLKEMGKEGIKRVMAVLFT